MNFLRLLILPLLAAALLLTAGKRVFCRRRHSTTATIGALEKANSVSLCVPDARGRHLEETREVSEVQDETRPEADRKEATRSRISLRFLTHDVRVHRTLWSLAQPFASSAVASRCVHAIAVVVYRDAGSDCQRLLGHRARWPVAPVKQRAIAIRAFPRQSSQPMSEPMCGLDSADGR